VFRLAKWEEKYVRKGHPHSEKEGQGLMMDFCGIPYDVQVYDAGLIRLSFLS
jgi:hypothetical protein